MERAATGGGAQHPYHHALSRVHTLSLIYQKKPQKNRYSNPRYVWYPSPPALYWRLATALFFCRSSRRSPHPHPTLPCPSPSLSLPVTRRDLELVRARPLNRERKINTRRHLDMGDLVRMAGWLFKAKSAETVLANRMGNERRTSNDGIK